MRRAIRMTLFVAFAVLVSTAFAADSPKTVPAVPAATPESMADHFFELLKAGKPDEAFDSVWNTNPWTERQKDSAQQLKSRLHELSSLVGEFGSYEPITRRAAGTRLVYLSYLAAYDRQPIRFEFEFYRARDKWVLYTVSFDDAIDEDLKRDGRADTSH